MFLDVIDNSLGKTITDILATQEITQPFPVIHIGICYLFANVKIEQDDIICATAQGHIFTARPVMREDRTRTYNFIGVLENPEKSIEWIEKGRIEPLFFASEFVGTQRCVQGDLTPDFVPKHLIYW